MNNHFSNRRDVEQYVEESLGEWAEGFNIEGIVDQLAADCDEYLYDGNHDDFDDDYFWTVVDAHAICEQQLVSAAARQQYLTNEPGADESIFIRDNAGYQMRAPETQIHIARELGRAEHRALGIAAHPYDREEQEMK
jgi:hypothetical protein